MAAQASIIHPVRLVGVLASLIPPVLFVAASTMIWGGEQGVPIGLFAYVFYRLIVVRRIVCRDQRLGTVLTRRGKFDDAIAAFRRSEKFWEKHPTIDRFRSLMLGSPTSHTFHVFALYNQAYCLSRLGRGAEAHALVETLISKHPDMLQARELRDILVAGKSNGFQG